MLKLKTIKTITELREDPLEVFKESSREPTFIFSRSKPVGVVMGVKKYNQLMEMLEDYLDSLELEMEAATVKDSELVPLDKFWKKHKLKK